MKETKTNVMRILEKEKIDYEAKFYPHGKEAYGWTVWTCY